MGGMIAVLRVTAFVVSLALASIVVRVDAQQKTVSASNGWVQTPAPGETTAKAFVVVDNPTMYDVYVVAAASDVSDAVQIRDATPKAATPTPVKELTAPAYGQVAMKPDGIQLWLTGLKKPLKAGDTVNLTLTTDGNLTLQVSATVRDK
jgi:periplasmic copper chaperone A